MRRLKYYLLGIPIMVLLFSFNAYAYTNYNVSGSATDSSGATINVRAQGFSGVTYDVVEETQNGQTVEWNLVQNIQIYTLSKNNYYSGVIEFRVNTTPSVTLTDRHNPILQANKVADGLYVFISAQDNTGYRVEVVFDNYYTVDSWVGLPSITQKFFLAFTQISDQNLTQNFPVTITSLDASTLAHQTTPLDGGLAKLITDSIDDSTALAVIAGWLYDIKTQDYTYYIQLTTQLANMIAAQGTTNARLQSLLDEIDLDFQQVQSILDLFPSYRTQVLQYWQELLQMNASQSSAAAEIESQYADRESQSSQLINGMGSVVMPSISSNDLDILGTVDTTQKANFFGIIALITHNELVTKIMLIIVLGAIVGYILYGKK